MSELVNRVSSSNLGNVASVATAATEHVAGNLLVACVLNQTNSSTWEDASLTDTAGNTWVRVADDFTAGSNNLMRLYYAANCKGHATNVVTAAFTGGVGPLSLSVLQFTAPGAALTDHGEATGTGTDVTTDTLSLDGATAGILVALILSDSQQFTAGDGFTLNRVDGGFSDYLADEYAIVTADGPADATCGNNTYGIVAAAFSVQAPSGGGGYGTWAAPVVLS